jgi:hypothetical protein
MNAVILQSLLMIIPFNDGLRADFTRYLTTDVKHRMHVSQRVMLDAEFLVSSFFFSGKNQSTYKKNN